MNVSILNTIHRHKAGETVQSDVLHICVTRNRAAGVIDFHSDGSGTIARQVKSNHVLHVVQRDVAGAGGGNDFLQIRHIDQTQRNAACGVGTHFKVFNRAHGETVDQRIDAVSGHTQGVNTQTTFDHVGGVQRVGCGGLN